MFNDHFGVEDISEAIEYISRPRIHKQIENLGIYCTVHEMVPLEFSKYVKEPVLKVKYKFAETSSEILKEHLDKR